MTRHQAARELFDMMEDEAQATLKHLTPAQRLAVTIAIQALDELEDRE